MILYSQITAVPIFAMFVSAHENFNLNSSSTGTMIHKQMVRRVAKLGCEFNVKTVKILAPKCMDVLCRYAKPYIWTGDLSSTNFYYPLGYLRLVMEPPPGLCGNYRFGIYVEDDTIKLTMDILESICTEMD